MKRAIYNEPFGSLEICHDNDFVYSVSRLYPQKFGGKSETDFFSDSVIKQYREYFKGQRKIFDFPIKLIGTSFQKAVWNELLKIPYGCVCSYKDIAIAIDNPKACRAVGMANHVNPIVICVPCHRVISSDGTIGGYATGLDLKKELLELEQKYK